jgi:DNA-binding response OmpR family regulator
MKILLIDDSRVVQHTQQKALVNAGYKVLSARDGEEGLRIARETNPDLIVLDIMLPKIAGQDVLRTLQRDTRTKHIPVVVLSSLSSLNAPKFIEEGAAQFVEKSDDLLDRNSQAVVDVVGMVLSKTDRCMKSAATETLFGKRQVRG